MSLGIKSCKLVRSLGAGLGAGARRNVAILGQRLRAFQKKVPMFIVLRRLGVDAARIARAGGTAAMVYGMGVRAYQTPCC